VFYELYPQGLGVLFDLILKNRYASIAISLGKNTVTLIIKRIFVIFVERKVTPHMESLFAIIVIKN